MYDIVALGECLIDFTPDGCTEDGIPVYRQNPGGAPANVLAMASILGRSTAFIGRVGNDAFGQFMRARLEAAGLDCSSLIIDREHPTSIAFVTLDEHGNRSFSFYRKGSADLMLSDEDIDDDKVSGATIFHFGSVSMTDEPGRSTTINAVRKFRAAGAIVSYDPNYRPLLWKSDDEARSVMSSVIEYCDIVKISEEELLFIAGTSDLSEGAGRILAMGPAAVIVTRGAGGAFIMTGKHSGSFRTFDVETVDTTGAGDSFYGAFLAMLIEKGYRTKDDLKGLSLDDIESSMVFANAAGSLSTAKLGAIPSMPSRNDIENCIRNCALL